MNIRFAEDGDLDAIIRFNNRLRAGGRKEQITLHVPLPGEARYRPEGFPVYRRLMIAEDGQEVRAVLALYHHNIFIEGKKRDFCWTDYSISEGTIDPRYSFAMIKLIRQAIAYQPFLM